MRALPDATVKVVLTVAVAAVFAWAGQRGLEARRRLAPGFEPPRRQTATPGEPMYTAQFIDVAAGGIEHVPSICELPGGRLIAVWYRGSRPTATDVAIVIATRGAEPTSRWSAPRVVVSAASAAAELHRPVGKVGNAVVFADGDGRLFLVYVSMPFGGWATSALNLKSSPDGGTSWTPSRRLVLSPLLNLGTLVKNKPLPLACGGFLLPISHEQLERFADLLWLGQDDGGVSALRTTRLCGGPRYFQPGLVALDARRGAAVLRSARVGGEVGLATSSDGGASWSSVRPSPLPNPDSGLDAVVLPDGRMLLAFNDESAGRSNLSLAVSNDAGTTWRRIATLEDEHGGEFSYPFLLRTRSGRIHVVYAWNRRGIKEVTFTAAWIEAKEREAR